MLRSAGFRCSVGRNCVERDGLHVRHYAEVEHAVEEANAPPELSVRDPAVGPGMVRLQMLDNASGFDHGSVTINQQGELSERPTAAQLLAVLGVIGAKHTERERGRIRP